MPKAKIEEEAVAPEAIVESEAKKKFRQIIEDYKVQNPVKYEMKKEALEAKLNTL